MRLLLIVQVLIVGFYRERPQVRPSYPTDGVTESQVSFLSLVFL